MKGPYGRASRTACVTGLTHQQAYRDIFASTPIKTAAVAVLMGVFYLKGIY